MNALICGSLLLYCLGGPALADDNPCGDLICTDLRVVADKKKSVEIEYTIKNVGSETVYLLGTARDRSANVGIQFYLSGDTELNSGDVLTDGFFIIKAPNNGVLNSGDSYTARAKVRTPKRNAYNSVLIMRLDALNTVEECDETNNEIFLQL